MKKMEKSKSKTTETKNVVEDDDDKDNKFIPARASDLKEISICVLSVVAHWQY
jgi:hypothetical protein